MLARNARGFFDECAKSLQTRHRGSQSVRLLEQRIVAHYYTRVGGLAGRCRIYGKLIGPLLLRLSQVGASARRRNVMGWRYLQPDPRDVKALGI